MDRGCYTGAFTQVGGAAPQLQQGLFTTSQQIPRHQRAGCFCAASFGSALGWLSYAPIADIAQRRFDVGPSAVNLLGNLFLILYVPGSALSLWLTEARSRC